MWRLAGLMAVVLMQVSMLGGDTIRPPPLLCPCAQACAARKCARVPDPTHAQQNGLAAGDMREHLGSKGPYREPPPDQSIPPPPPGCTSVMVAGVLVCS
jgi:hypothetical protein